MVEKKAKEYFFDKFEIIENTETAEGAEETREQIVQVNAIILGLGLSEDFVVNEDTEERIDALFEHFRVSLDQSLERLKLFFEVINKFGINIQAGNSLQFIERIEFVSELLEFHGLVSAIELEQSDLSKLEDLYKSLGVELKEVDSMFQIKLAKIDFSFTRDLKNTEEEILARFQKFAVEFGISLKQEIEVLGKISNFKEILLSLGYGEEEWLEEKELKKIKLFLKENDLTSLEALKAEQINVLQSILEAFGTNFKNLLLLKLKKQIDLLKALKIDLNVPEDQLLKLLNFAKAIAEIDNLQDLSVEQAKKVTELRLKLDIDSREALELDEFLRFLKEEGIDVSLKAYDKDLDKKITEFIRVSVEIAGKDFGQLKISEMLGVKQIISLFVVKKIFEIDASDTAHIKSFVQEFGVNLEDLNIQSGTVEVLNKLELGLDKKDKYILKNTADLFRKLELDILSLNLEELEFISNICKEFSFDIGEEVRNIPEQILSTFEGLGLSKFSEITSEGVDKIKLVIRLFGLEKIGELEASHFSYLEVLESHYERQILDLTAQEINSMVEVLGMFEWLKNIEAQNTSKAKEELTAIEEILKESGFGGSLNIEAETLNHLKEVLAVLKAEKSLNRQYFIKLSKFCRELGLDINSYKLLEATKAAKKVGLDIDSQAFLQEAEQFKYLIEDISELNIDSFAEEEGMALKETLARFNISFKSSKEDLSLFKQTLLKLGFSFPLSPGHLVFGKLSQAIAEYCKTNCDTNYINLESLAKFVDFFLEKTENKINFLEADFEEIKEIITPDKKKEKESSLLHQDPKEKEQDVSFNYDTEASLLRVGTIADNYWCGECKIYDRKVGFELKAIDDIEKFSIKRVGFDDYLWIKLNNHTVFVGPDGGDRVELTIKQEKNNKGYHEVGVTTDGSNFKKCEGAISHTHDTEVDLKPYLLEGKNNIWMRVLVDGCGEGWMEIDVQQRYQIGEKHEFKEFDANTVSAENKPEENLVGNQKTETDEL